MDPSDDHQDDDRAEQEHEDVDRDVRQPVQSSGVQLAVSVKGDGWIAGTSGRGPLVPWSTPRLREERELALGYGQIGVAGILPASTSAWVIS